MAAKSKKRLSKIENKLLKLDKLELKDVFCSICQSILFEPVTLPCFHDFCLRCFKGSIENNALCCPLCRLRIGSWLRVTTKQKNLVNVELWNFIQSKFSREIDIKIKGDDIELPEEIPKPRLSAPGEIRIEYESELKRLREERLRLEQKQFQETELFIKKLQQEEEDAHKKYLEALKQDEILAQQMQNNHRVNNIISAATSTHKRANLRTSTIKPRLKATKIDCYLSNNKTHKSVARHLSPNLIDDSTTSTDSSTPKIATNCQDNVSPEIVPSYGKQIKNLKLKNGTSIWNKENGDNVKEKKDPVAVDSKCVENTEGKHKSKHGVQSVLVSLPLPCGGIPQYKSKVVEIKNLETDSVDSMQQELCYFKPIEGTTPTNFYTNKSLLLRVPGVRAERVAETDSAHNEDSPSRAQYLDSLCRLRDISLTKNLPSAFVIALKMLRVNKGHQKCTNNKSKIKKTASTSPSVVPTLPHRKNGSNRQKQIVDGIAELNKRSNLRRTRSMGSITKEVNETTPKKAKNDRKVCSDRKPHLRSDSKRSDTKKEANSPPLLPETTNNNKVNLAVKNLSSPLKNCDVTKILEQLRIEKLLEQEKSDFELARKMDAEWNQRRLPRRAAPKRALALACAPRAAKKLRA